MNILLYRWGAYTEQDLISELSNAGNKVDVFIYQLSDKNNDEVFEKKMTSYIKDKCFDLVFSVNYFPVLASVCHKENIKYVSWSYDAPLNVINIEETLGLPTNYVFMFDRDQVNKYVSMGFDNVYHLPLAVNTKRYNSISCSKSEQEKYGGEVSFVGNMYADLLNSYIAPLTDYQQGFIKGLCASQSQIYGYYMLDELIDDKLISDINKRYVEVAPDTKIVMSKEALVYAMASGITREERLKILGILSTTAKLKYYSKEKSEILKKAVYSGVCDYLDEMPRIFKTSKINLNITLKILTSGIPLRALDIMGCGGFLLSNFQPELNEYFVNGEEMVMYESIEDAYEKAIYYLQHDDLRDSIAKKGYIKTKEMFSYEQQLAKMFDIVCR